VSQSVNKVTIQSNPISTLKALKAFVDDAIEKVGGDQYYCKVTCTWKGHVNSITIDTTGTTFGENGAPHPLNEPRWSDRY
jgi:hypothetical protein